MKLNNSYYNNKMLYYALHLSCEQGLAQILPLRANIATLWLSYELQQIKVV